MTPEFFSVNDLASRWNCNPMSVYRLVESGKIKCFRIGRAIRIAKAEVERYERGE